VAGLAKDHPLAQFYADILASTHFETFAMVATMVAELLSSCKIFDCLIVIFAR
jgi:hypothetical protein